MKQEKNLDEWLVYLEALHPSTIELGLDRIKVVADRLGLVFNKSKIIIVGGTNGKGSSISMLGSILRHAGFTVASYTSPHIIVYNERVTLNGRQATDEELCAAFIAVEKARENVQLTYFEFGTLAALYHFARLAPDFILLEVGLGGRLDAVNIVEPDLSLLTNVALDHTDWLGETREAIGYEKAGIFRQDKPALYAEVDMPDSVAAVVASKGANLARLGRDWYWERNSDNTWNWYSGNGKSPLAETACATQPAIKSLQKLPDNGFPLDNCAAVIQSLFALEIAVQETDIIEGLRAANLAGRFQQVRFENHDVILDVAHNPHAAANLALNLKRSMAGRPLHMVVAMLRDKDSGAVLEQLMSVADSWHIGQIEDERGAEAKIIYNQLLEFGESNITCHDSVKAAFRQACELAGNDACIVVTGSFFTVSAVLELI